jgi:hypothetical protein
MSARTTVTVTDQIGGESAGFDVWCSGVVGDDVPTPTPTQTPVPTNTPVPTATATATSTATHTPTPEPTRPELVMTEYELHYYYEGTELPPAVRLLVAGTQQWIEFPLTWVNTFCGCKMAHLPEWVVGVEVGGAIPLRLDAEGWYLYDRRFMRGQQVFLSLVQR